MKVYGSDVIEMLAQRYIDKGGVVYELIEGTLGWGLTVMTGQGLKTTVVKEVYLNSWSSGHTVRMYNKCPKKYQTLIDEYTCE